MTLQCRYIWYVSSVFVSRRCRVVAACLLSAIAAGGAAAAERPQRPATAEFRATLVGSVTKGWDYTELRECNPGDPSTERNRWTGGFTVDYTTKRPWRIRVTRSAAQHGRVVFTRLREVFARARGGADLESRQCAANGGGTALYNYGGFDDSRTVSIGLAKRGSNVLVVGNAFSVWTARGEPPSRDPGLHLAVGRVSYAELFDQRLDQIVVEGRHERTFTVAAPNDGEIDERVVWRLTLQRIR